MPATVAAPLRLHVGHSGQKLQTRSIVAAWRRRSRRSSMRRCSGSSAAAPPVAREEQRQGSRRSEPAVGIWQLELAAVRRRGAAEQRSPLVGVLLLLRARAQLGATPRRR
jgi:hypothetical protein